MITNIRAVQSEALALFGAKSGKPRKPKLPPIDTQTFVEATRALNDAPPGHPLYDWYRLVLPYPPSLNNMFPTSKSGIRFLSDEGKRFKKAVASIVLQLGCRPLVGRVWVYIKYYRPRDAGDIDNYAKAPLDALRGIAFTDDSKVRKLMLDQDEDPAFPRIMVSVRLAAGQTLNLQEFFQ